MTHYAQAALASVYNGAAPLTGIRDCHVKGLHSIVLNQGQFLDRVYITTEEHALHHNFTLNADMTLGVHAHNTGIVINQLYGRMTNMEYLDSPLGMTYGAMLHEVGHYWFESKIRGGEGKLHFLGMAHLWEHTQTELHPAQVLRLDADQLHTVAVAEGQRAAWLIREFLPNRINPQYCYTRNPNFQSQEIYQPMDDAACREMLADVLNVHLNPAI